MAEAPSTVEALLREASGSAPAGTCRGPEIVPVAGDDSLQYHEARPGWQLLDIRALWQFRQLLWILAVRDLKVRYRQTLVGVAWVVLQPLTTMGIFLVLFGLLGRQPASREVPYGLVVLSGLLPWQLFASTVSQASASLVNNQHLIGKVYFPRLVLPLATAIPSLVDFGVGLAVLAGAMAYHRFAPSWSVVLLPAFALFIVLAALALGIWLSALNAMYRDVGYLVSYLIQVGFFVSPVVYEVSALVPERWRPVFALNPMAGAIEGFRWSLLGQGPIPFWSLLDAVVVVAFLLVTGLAYFRRVERFVADRI